MSLRKEEGQEGFKKEKKKKCLREGVASDELRIGREERCALLEWKMKEGGRKKIDWLANKQGGSRRASGRVGRGGRDENITLLPASNG